MKLGIVPKQKEGIKSDTGHSVTCLSEKEAAEKFQSSANRLLNINERLTDRNGKPVNRLAGLGDYFRINIPGPGSATGKGYDWVKIETIDDHRDPTGAKEEVSFRVRPAANPTTIEKDTAHFFSNGATSTFSVTRNKKTITAAVHGRNESPNIRSDRSVDKLRNAVVATGAISGLAKLQWKKLVKGILGNGHSRSASR
jgi:hypothetical protein